MKLRILVALAMVGYIVLVGIPRSEAQTRTFTMSCPEPNGNSMACRVFQAVAGSQVLMLQTYWYWDGESSAENALSVMEIQGAQADPDLNADFGEGTRAWRLPMVPDLEGSQAVAIAFTYEKALMVWSSAGFLGDPLLPFEGYYDWMLGELPNATTEAEMFWLTVPAQDDIPAYEMVKESVDAAPFSELRVNRQPSDPTMTPSDDATNLQATIESFETTVAELQKSTPSAPTSTPRPRPTERPAPTATRDTSRSGTTLKLIDINAKDAGVGNGTIYVYADLYNGSSEFYSFVQLTATCKDSSGSVVGTGLGFVQNVGPGESVTATIIVFNVPTCDAYSVRIDSAF